MAPLHCLEPEHTRSLKNLNGADHQLVFGGRLAGLGIPVFNGVQKPSQDEARQLCAALATSGGVTMCHIAGVTPESPTLILT